VAVAPSGRAAGELEADHLGDDHRDRLTQHRRLGLDAAHAPAEHAEAVDHRGVAVGADEGVGKGHLSVALGSVPDHLPEILEVDLVADPGAGRHHPEIVERLRAPAQECVALGVALVLALDVDRERARVAERVDLHRVVDDQVDRRERVDLVGIAAEFEHRLAHRGEIDHRGHAGEVLHQHARRAIGDLLIRASILEPPHQGLQVLGRHTAPVLEAEQVLEQHLERIRQPRDVAELLARGLEREIVVARIAHAKLAAGAETVVTECGHGSSPSMAPAARSAQAEASADRRRLRIRRDVSSARVLRMCTVMK